MISSFADGPVNLNPIGPAEDKTQKLILSTENQNYSMISDQAEPTINCSGFIQLLYYCVAGNFCGSLFLQIGNFLCFAGTNFCAKNRLVFLAGN